MLGALPTDLQFMVEPLLQASALERPSPCSLPTDKPSNRYLLGSGLETPYPTGSLNTATLQAGGCTLGLKAPAPSPLPCRCPQGSLQSVQCCTSVVEVQHRSSYEGLMRIEAVRLQAALHLQSNLKEMSWYSSAGTAKTTPQCHPHTQAAPPAGVP